LEKIKLGGLKQSVLIRGDDLSNPILLFLHGGPGMPLMYMAHSFQDSLEKEFIVVQYDRRGAGKSYNKRIDPTTITDQQYYEDAIELVHYLCKRFNKRKVFLVGHSWGTYLGSILAHENPELFYTYISIGQVVNSKKARLLQDNFITKKANELNRAEALEDLKKYGYQAHEKWLFKFGAQIHTDTSYQVFVKEGMRSPEYSLFDALKISKGSQFCQNNIKYKIIPSAIIEDSIQSYSIPCFFIVGKYDMTTPKPLIVDYFNSISCPKKELIVFEQSAHFPFYEEKELFSRELRKIKYSIMDSLK
jgi:pimeloyl-ACP methyl ester carboxylesterase